MGATKPPKTRRMEQERFEGAFWLLDATLVVEGLYRGPWHASLPLALYWPTGAGKRRPSPL